MKKILLAGLFALFSTGLFAQTFDFTLVNKTGFDIEEVYVSPADDEEWGDDVLGVDILENGKKVEVEFDGVYEAVLLAFGVDKYDLKVIDEDGDEYEYYDLKLEEIMEITLTLDKKGNGVATFK